MVTNQVCGVEIVVRAPRVSSAWTLETQMGWASTVIWWSHQQGMVVHVPVQVSQTMGLHMFLRKMLRVDTIF